MRLSRRCAWETTLGRSPREGIVYGAKQDWLRTEGVGVRRSGAPGEPDPSVSKS
jgi:hypothetical protein